MNWQGLFSIFSGSSHSDDTTASIPVINPANGLPMMDGIGGFDIAGNTFGHDMHQTDLTHPIVHHIPPTDWQP